MLIYACPPPSMSCFPSPQDGLQQVSETHGVVSVTVMGEYEGSVKTMFDEVLDHYLLEKERVSSKSGAGVLIFRSDRVSSFYIVGRRIVCSNNK